MEDNYLDNKFREIFDNPPEFEADPTAIADMNRRLDQAERQRRRTGFGLWWLIPLLVLPFLFGSVFFYTKYHILNQKLDELNLQLTHFQKDTLTENHITYHYDTIYNTIYKDIIVERHFKKSVVPPQGLGTGYTNYYTISNLSGSRSLTDFSVSDQNGLKAQKGFNFNIDLSAYPNQGTNLKLSKNFNQQSKFSDYYPNENVRSIGLKTIDPYTRFDDFSDLMNYPDWEPGSPKINPIYYFIPKGINTGGNFMPVVLGKAGSKSYNAKNFGISANLEFYNDIELQLGIERLGIGFEIKDQNEMARYPIAEPENPNDFLKELYTDFTYVQIPIVFRKFFRKDKELKPFFGVGMTAVKPLKQNFRYEFDTPTNEEYKLSQNLKNGNFSVNNLRTNLGIRYRFFDNFSAQTEVAYQHGFGQGTGEYFKLRYWAWNVGLRYHL